MNRAKRKGEEMKKQIEMLELEDRTNRSVKVKLHDVRLLTYALDEPTSFTPDGPCRYSASFLIRKSDRASRHAVYDAMHAVVTSANVGDATIWLRDRAQMGVGIPLLCARDQSAYLPKQHRLCSTRPAFDGRPKLYTVGENSKRKVVKNPSDVFYAGCRVDAVVEFWFYKRKYAASGVGCKLLELTFVRDGKRITPTLPKKTPSGSWGLKTNPPITPPVWITPDRPLESWFPQKRTVVQRVLAAFGFKKPTQNGERG